MHAGLDELAGRKSRRHASDGSNRRLYIRRAIGFFLSVGLLVAGGQGGAGHQVGHYPSFYPHEIVIEALDPIAAAKRLSDKTLHAYIGAAPAFAGSAPGHLQSFKSLGSFLVLSFGARFTSADMRCATAREFLAVLSKEKIAGFVFHPYPVTPYHADYLHHLDRIDTARAAVGRASAAASSLRVGAKGRLARTIVKARWGLAADGADVVLQEVPAVDLVAATAVQFNGWSGPPWEKEGWFQAYQLLAPALDARARQAADEIYERLIRGEVRDLTEHVNLERKLIAALVGGCTRLVVGYAPRQEYVDARYPTGIENVAFDSLSGLNSPVFPRTAKLMEYPWNGVLQLGVRQRATAAWNPVAGFSDKTGKLIWSVIGDPALMHIPFNASWMPNRVQSSVTKVKGRSGGITVPADAILPQPGTGMFRQVGARTFASAKVVYEVLASPFQDGSAMGIADILYPYVFSNRWGSKATVGDNMRDPRLAARFDAIQERLAGLRVLRVEKSNFAIAEGLTVTRRTPIVEVYLREAAGDERQMAALAPPWSTVPWHLLVLMEEAVKRGYAAFSEEEARRRGVPWLDLVRDPPLMSKLQDLIAQFERERYRPKPLEEFVTAEEAQARWRTLLKFAEKKGHLLITNGPYLLKQWTPDRVVLQAFRDLTYPLGFGTFDRFANPPRGVIESAKYGAGRVTVRAGAELILKTERTYMLRKEPLLRTTMRGVTGLLVVSRYLLIGPDGTVLNVDKMRWEEDGRFTVTLPERLPAGEYTIVVAVFLDGNSLLPSTGMVRIRVGGAAPRAN